MRYTKKLHVQPLAAALIGLGLSLSIPATGFAGEGSEYLTNSAGEVVMTGYKECWTALGGLEAPIEACGDTISVAKFEEADSDGDGVPDGEDQCPDTPQGVEVDENGCPIDTDGDGVPDYLDKCPGTPAGSKVDSKGCKIIEDLVLKVTTDHFKFDSSKLEPGMINQLDEVMAKIAASPGDEKLQIIGHTDSTGPESYNQDLSERRAKAVADYLAEQGMSSDKLAVKGMGESQPVAENDTREGRSMNRRVEILTR